MIREILLAVILFGFSLMGYRNVVFADSSPSYGQIVFLDSNDVPSIVNILSSGTNRDVELDVADWTERFTIIMPEFAGTAWNELKARQRQVRCLSISNEGPRLDFYDWKSQATSWKDLAKIQSIKWKSASFDTTDYGALPQISQDEIESEVRRSFKDSPQDITEWLSLARKCAEHPESCLGECLSEVQFYHQRRGSEEVVTTIRIRIPMGC